MGNGTSPHKNGKLESARSFARFGYNLIGWMAVTISTIAIGTAGWTMMQIYGLNSRVATIEANRFTHQDGSDLKNFIFETREIIRKEIRENVPPPWFLAQFSDLRQKFEKHVDGHYKGVK